MNSSNYVSRLLKDLVKNKWVYLMVLPVIAFYAIFCYKPMYGAIIVFKDFTPSLGIFGSPWVGFKHFEEFFSSMYFWRLMKNTVTISLTSLIFGFPAPIILAILINEVRNKHYMKFVQTASYLPHFISLVVICGMIKEFTMDTGLVNDIVAFFGGTRLNMLNKSSYFVPIYVISNIWQEIGWGSIIYLASMSGINNELYEAANIDGANRLKQIIHITIPGIMPTIITLLILRVGNILNVGFEKIILLYNASTYETADVISSYVYRKGLQEFSWSFSTAVGVFNSVINFIFLIAANYFSKKTQNTFLW